MGIPICGYCATRLEELPAESCPECGRVLPEPVLPKPPPLNRLPESVKRDPTKLKLSLANLIAWWSFGLVGVSSGSYHAVKLSEQGRWAELSTVPCTVGLFGALAGGIAWVGTHVLAWVYETTAGPDPSKGHADQDTENLPGPISESPTTSFQAVLPDSTTDAEDPELSPRHVPVPEFPPDWQVFLPTFLLISLLVFTLTLIGSRDVVVAFAWTVLAGIPGGTVLGGLRVRWARADWLTRRNSPSR